MKSLLLALVLMMAMDGDDHGNQSNLKEWFNALKSEKGPCCSFADGFTISDADWKSDDGHYSVRIPQYKPDSPNGSSRMIWVDVPDDAVIHEPNLYGHTVVWPIWNKVSYAHPIIRCFIPGTMT